MFTTPPQAAALHQLVEAFGVDQVSVTEGLDELVQSGGLVRVEDGPGAWPAAHQTTSLQTGQARRRLRRSQRAWVRAMVSWKPHMGHEATQRPCSRCRVGSGLGWVG